MIKPLGPVVREQGASRKRILPLVSTSAFGKRRSASEVRVAQNCRQRKQWAGIAVEIGTENQSQKVAVQRPERNNQAVMHG